MCDQCNYLLTCDRGVRHNFACVPLQGSIYSYTWQMPATACALRERFVFFIAKQNAYAVGRSLLFPQPLGLSSFQSSIARCLSTFTSSSSSDSLALDLEATAAASCCCVCCIFCISTSPCRKQPSKIQATLAASKETQAEWCTPYLTPKANTQEHRICKHAAAQQVMRYTLHQ